MVVGMLSGSFSSISVQSHKVQRKKWTELKFINLSSILKFKLEFINLKYELEVNFEVQTLVHEPKFTKAIISKKIIIQAGQILSDLSG